MSGALARDACILVIAVARIGDTLLVTPAMRAAKESCPRGRLTVLAHPKRVEVLSHLPFIDRLGTVDKLRALFRGWAGRREHDAALVFGRDVSLVRYALRVAQRVAAYDEPDFPDDPRLLRVRPEQGTHAVLERLRLASALGLAAADRRLAYCVTAEERRTALERLAQRWPNPAGPLVALQMCSFPTKAQRDWPVEYFIELAQRLAEDRPETRFVVLGDAAARRAAEPFMARHGARTLLTAGDTRLREAAALTSVAQLYVGVDTGPTHIAGALGVPMVALYHCDYPGRNLVPLDHPSCAMIEHPLTGGDCRGARMDAIPIAEVHRAAALLLQQRASQAEVRA
jgi:heptosyltransferase-3